MSHPNIHCSQSLLLCTDLLAESFTRYFVTSTHAPGVQVSYDFKHQVKCICGKVIKACYCVCIKITNFSDQTLKTTWFSLELLLQHKISLQTEKPKYFGFPPIYLDLTVSSDQRIVSATLTK